MDKKPTYEELEQHIKQLERKILEYAKNDTKTKRQIELLNLTQRISKIGGWAWDIATQSMFWTEETYRIHGINPQDIGTGTEDHILNSILCYDENDRPILLDAFNRCIDDGTPYDMELPFTQNGGKKIFIRTSARGIKKDGKVIRILGNIADITKQKQAELLLKKSEKNLRESQRIAHLGSWQLDIKTNDVVWTEELYHMYGFDPTLPPPPYTEHMKLFTPESWQQLSMSLDRTRKTGIPYELELETIKKDGTNGWMWVRGEAVRDFKGGITGLWGAAQDISERKQNEREREMLIQELEKSLAEIKRLQGILPLCSFCKKIRDDVGNWEAVDVYIHKHSSADISHSICPECMKKHYPEEYTSIYSGQDKS